MDEIFTTQLVKEQGKKESEKVMALGINTKIQQDINAHWMNDANIRKIRLSDEERKGLYDLVRKTAEEIEKTLATAAKRSARGKS